MVKHTNHYSKFCAKSDIFEYNSFEDKIPPHAMKSDIECTFRAKITRRYNENLCLVINKDGEEAAFVPMKWTGFLKGYDIVTAKLHLETGLYWYHFKTDKHEFLKNGCGNWQITVYDKNFTTPDWIKGGIMYHIFVDRFNRGKDTPKKEYAYIHENKSETPFYAPDEYGSVSNTDFYGGNLDGITNKLEYIKSLGVNAIYLSPVFDARSNHKYDTGNYEKIDEMFGTQKDFEILCEKAKERDIKIICDGVFNHTGDDSVYFNKYRNYEGDGAYNSKNSPYFNWYNFKTYPDDYECWWGIKILPQTNKQNEDFLNYITGENGILRKWMKLGASSWRLDVADELPDVFLDKIREAAKTENPDALIIGEVWEDASNKISYGARRRYLLGAQLDSVMNYPLKGAIINFVLKGDGRALNDEILTQIENYPPQVINCLMNILSTHDTWRVLSALGCEKSFSSKHEMAAFSLNEAQLKTAEKRLFCAALLQMTLPGVPCIFYGDEAGMQGFADPFCRGYFQWGNENRNILEFYKKITALRRENSVFKTGGYETVFAENGVFVFKRFDETQNIMVGVNVSGKSIKLKKAVFDELSKNHTDIFNSCIFTKDDGFEILEDDD